MFGMDSRRHSFSFYMHASMCVYKIDDVKPFIQSIHVHTRHVYDSLRTYVHVHVRNIHTKFGLHAF